MNPLGSVTQPGATSPALAGSNAAGRQDEASESFSDVLSGLVDDVNTLQSKAGALRDQLTTGEAGDLHPIMIAAEEAGIALELLVEVRNKLVEAYQELLRMPV